MTDSIGFWAPPGSIDDIQTGRQRQWLRGSSPKKKSEGKEGDADEGDCSLVARAMKREGEGRMDEMA
jgi:hypothetical protein